MNQIDSGYHQRCNPDRELRASDDVTIYGSPSASQNFTMSVAPFIGTMHVDMFSYASALPTCGTTGAIYSGYLQSGTAGHGVVLGQWQTVLEPPPVALAAAGMLTLAIPRRRAARAGRKNCSMQADS